MGRLKTAVADCYYEETDRQLKEQFIHGLNANSMLAEIISDITAIKNTTVVTNSR